jgi:hypothetical protein
MIFAPAGRTKHRDDAHDCHVRHEPGVSSVIQRQSPRQPTRLYDVDHRSQGYFECEESMQSYCHETR